ncbi:hypothetical protein E0Z10_g7384 [Xylaria hypoxylon]|uniref:Uncharacterized protein n=1 Tax=Xylaria hypoxylon TaxID=37992 RepID=A0A4Z0YQS3_9PEZI|nr:hypothetical protein E0Z10_g7384 [Xylaria hypoxylon]
MQLNIAMIAAALAGLSATSPVPSNTRRYAPGKCYMHVTQWQKNENGVGSDYQYDVRLKDAILGPIGGVNRLAVPYSESRRVVGGKDSELPYDMIITSGAVDKNPVQFAYAGQYFSSSKGCSTGGYENGNRDMDCSFRC